MNPEKILQALQAGEISLEDAERELSRAGSGAEEEVSRIQPSQAHPEVRSEGDQLKPASGKLVTVSQLAPGIAQIQMADREHKNSFTLELMTELAQAFEVVNANPENKAVILTGYDGYFASGGTQEGLLAIADGKVKFTDFQIYHLALECPVPVIAAMQGHAIGAGWSVGMFCDFIVMSRESIYASNYMRYGFTPGAGATLVFPEKLGMVLAQEILFTANNYRGAELEAKGVPFPVLPRAEVLPYAQQLATHLAQSPRESLVALKAHLTEAIRSKVASCYAKEVSLHDRTFVNRDEVKERIQTLYGASGKIQREKAVSPKAEFDAHPSSQAKTHSSAIAIIGMAGQFPKAKNLAEFWENLAQGRDCIAEVPEWRWPIDHYYDPDPKVPGKTYCRWMGVLEASDCFDPLFFNISPAEAELMDPQQRLFLENCWHCIEDAGINADTLSGSRCGVFVGCSPGDYNPSPDDSGLNAQRLMGGATSILAARISYYLNLKGPCLAIDTACSSSLVAMAEACNNLMLDRCDLALAGGVYASTGPAMQIMASQGMMLSAKGRCYTFDARADGFVIGEGVGVVLLKRLADAVRDHDSIYGVIRGWGVNQDGKTNGITAPSVKSQILLEQDVYRRFGIDPRSVTLVETHGTATKLGDPIEVEGLITAFRAFTDQQNFAALGSVKSNIGHLLAAAGVAGVIKVLLAMKHQQLPPTIHFATLNEHITLENSPFYINTELRPWENPDRSPRRAAVNAFGFSGTNAHVIIEEYLASPQGSPVSLSELPPRLAVLAAKTPERLKAVVLQMIDFIATHPGISLENLVYTLQTGRKAMEHRLAVVVSTIADLVQSLKAYGESVDEAPLTEWKAPLFTGVATAPATAAAKQQRDEAVQKGLRERHLERLAELWVAGAGISWDQLWQGEAVHRISLPLYPFERRRCWIKWQLPDSQPHSRPEGVTLGQEATGEIKVSLETKLTAIVAGLLGLDPQEVEPDISLYEYGMDSFVFIMLVRQFQTQINPWLDPASLQACQTIRDLLAVVQSYENQREPALTAHSGSEQQGQQFPELIRLNPGTQGRPVFWFHPALGGVELYQSIARKVARPFYGIQARGWMTDRTPLQGIGAMALYYFHIIKTIQPEGPYDLGGYSLGGILAYEVTRLLQEMGDQVNSLVLIDPHLNEEIANSAQDQTEGRAKTAMLQAVNMALLSGVLTEPERVFQKLVHRDELDFGQDEAAFIAQLIELARNRGLNKSQDQLEEQIRVKAKVQEAYHVDDYTLYVLPNPGGIGGYFIRNRNRLVMGELEPYFLPESVKLEVQSDAWETWKSHLPNVEFRNIDCSNHMMLLIEPRTLETITALCEALYMEQSERWAATTLNPKGEAETMEALKDKIRPFFKRFLRKHELGDDEDIMKLGIANSLFMNQLMVFLEKEFDLVIQDEPLERFRTLNQIAATVQDLRDHQDGAEAGMHFTLPGGTRIACLNFHETRQFYEDIFISQSYLKNGITLHDGDTVFDVGANIGLFSLFCLLNRDHTKVFAFEAVPQIFAVLEANLAPYGARTALFNYGIADREKEATFAYYPNTTGFSSFYGDLQEERATLKSVILNQMAESAAGMEQLLDETLDRRLECEMLNLRLRSLTQVMAEHQIAKVDLLKIDVQKSELDVLLGIADSDWAKILQIVIEVHDLDQRVANVTGLLQSKGYQVAVEQDALYKGTINYNVYATRSAPEKQVEL